MMAIALIIVSVIVSVLALLEFIVILLIVSSQNKKNKITSLTINDLYKDDPYRSIDILDKDNSIVNSITKEELDFIIKEEIVKTEKDNKNTQAGYYCKNGSCKHHISHHYNEVDFCYQSGCGCRRFLRGDV